MNQKVNTPPSDHSFFGRIFGFLGRHPYWVGAVIAIAYFGFYVIPHRSDPNGWDFDQMRRIPVVDQGRLKPLDTAARMNLMVLTHRQAFYNPKTKTTMPAIKWYLDSVTVPMPGNPALEQLFANSESEAWDYRIFRIENDQLLKMLKLDMREGLRYSLREIAPKFHEVQELVKGLQDSKKEPKNYDLLEVKASELVQHVRLYMDMATLHAPLMIPDPSGGDQWMSIAGYMKEAMQNGGQLGNGVDGEALRTYLKLLALYGEGEGELSGRQREFKSLLSAHLAKLDQTEPARMRAIDTEIFFNAFEPFYRCLCLYAVIALATALSWVFASTSWGPALRKACFAAMLVTFCIHFSGLILRMYLQDRWLVFVTNLYSSAVFIGLGCAAFCLIVEGTIGKNGIAMFVGSVLGFVTLIIAHLLSLDGDTMIMMQAVLDTNLWLATHVTFVSIGYVTVFVAGFMGCAYIILGVFTDKLRGPAGADLTRMTYGVLCTGMFFSFVGTVLGGLWADYSWGRFWGWDPKENGALLIVIWVALILHARWGGMVKQRGIAILSVLGVIVTAWSWFGTNFLGVGLHAYGGAKGTAMLAMVFIDFLFMGVACLGLLPLQHWQSFRPQPKPESTPPAPPPPPVAPTAVKAVSV